MAGFLSCCFCRPNLAQEEARGRARMVPDLLRRALGHDAPIGIPAGRAEVDHIIRGLDHVQIVLEDHHGCALVHQFLQHLDQLAGFVHVQPLVRHVQVVQGT